MAGLTERDLILLNAYLDGDLSARERRALEQRLAEDPALRSELEGLRATIALIGMAAPVRAPRSFTLDPALYGKPARRSFWDRIGLPQGAGLAAAGAALASTLLCTAALLLSVAGRPGAAADSVAMEEVAPEPMLMQAAEADMAAEEAAMDDAAADMPAEAPAAEAAEAMPEAEAPAGETEFAEGDAADEPADVAEGEGGAAGTQEPLTVPPAEEAPAEPSGGGGLPPEPTQISPTDRAGDDGEVGNAAGEETLAEEPVVEEDTPEEDAAIERPTEEPSPERGISLPPLNVTLLIGGSVFGLLTLLLVAGGFIFRALRRR